MASTQEPEVQFAQKLASNEKSVRTKAIRRLRKYLHVRSQKATGGFTSDELLKLWKGLFYCLWMQDQPLLQEELSKQISTLIHSFHDSDGQFLYLESFLQTFKREWTGIDRLRMDKFFQLVRFMFRQTFEWLKKKNWEMSLVSRFLQLLVAQLLQSGSAAPSGLQFHILDLYMTELAAVGSAELTADQNLTFIEPFCKTAARTKDRTLFSAICNSIFSTIIDQAPFAIEDLMKEMKAAEDSESEELSEEDHEDQKKENIINPIGKKATGKQINGHHDEEEEEELFHSDDSDSELPGDEDIGPVLQFDYTALSEKLLELSGRSNTLSQNRQRLYKIIKVLRDLGEGIFPQNEYPEEVSTDEDDEMFGSRKRMKRRAGHEDEEGSSAAKKGKKTEASTLKQQTKEQKDDGEQADLNANDENKKKKRKKKKKKAGKGGSLAGEENAETSEQGQNVAQVPTAVETEGLSQCSQEQDLESLADSPISCVKVTEAASSQSEGLLLSEGKKQPSVTVTEEVKAKPCTTGKKDQSQSFSKKKKNRDSQVTETGEDAPQAHTPLPGKKKNRRLSQIGASETQSQLNKEAKMVSISAETSETVTTTPKTEAVTPAKDRSKKKVVVEGKGPDTATTSEASQHTTAAPLRDTRAGEVPPGVGQNTVTPLKNKSKKTTVEKETPQGGGAEKLLFEITMTTPAKEKKTPKPKGTQTTDIRDESQLEAVGTVGEPEKVSARKLTKKRRKIPVVFEFEADEVEPVATNGMTEEETVDKKTKLGNDVEFSTPVTIKKSQKKAKTSSQSPCDFILFQSHAVAPSPLFCKAKGSITTPLSSKKKNQTPKSESKKVTFGLKNNKTAEFRKTDRSLLVSPDGSSRVAFDPKQKPKFGVLKSPPTQLSTPIRKTLSTGRKMNTPKSAPKRRPSAADFF